MGLLRSDITDCLGGHQDRRSNIKLFNLARPLVLPESLQGKLEADVSGAFLRAHLLHKIIHSRERAAAGSAAVAAY